MPAIEPFMTPQILLADENLEYYFDEGCFILELSNQTADPAVSIARAKVKPGVTTQWHILTTSVERYIVLAGEGLVEIGDLPPQLLKPGDVAIIPAQCRQRITNTSSVDLVFLAICTPRFTPECYQMVSD